MFNSGRASSASAGNGVGGGSLFGQNKPAGGGLFGQSNQQGQSGGLFGQGAQQNQTSGSQFGQGAQQGVGGSQFGQNTQNSNAQGQNATGTGFFGQNTQNTQNTGTGLFGQQGAASGLSNAANSGLRSGSTPGGGLFGQNTQNTSNPTGGLFGQNSNASGGTSSGIFGSKPSGLGTSSAAPSGGLFGNTSSNNTTTANNSVSGGLFGNASKNTGFNNSGGLFGNSSNNAASTTSTGLFGGNNSGSTTSTGLFGGNNAVQTSSGGLFGNKPAGTSLFGSANTNNALQPQMQMQPALQTLSQLPVNPMTRIADLPPQIRQEIEQLDQYIQRQVAISQHLKADSEDHMELIRSIPRDIKFLQTTHSLTHQSLIQDLRKITGIKDTIDQSMADCQTFSTILQQIITPGSKISSLELDKFFQDKILHYKHKLDEYFYVLSDIESAVQGIERDMFGATSTDGGCDSSGDRMNWKTGINAIVSTVLEEFELFMDMAERVAELHQRVKEISGDLKSSMVKV
ncbi:LAME_0F00870g1_1 [Lachancea meyersii CBS 8951]|uniref:LAME_0F00870g1_1 n=1 Tax=Lachancea meyersii CBS 8951 TaxID=1266667 RepID=A0A1G4JPG9_9SACH|nr:LAME_0F00870g1_1 [Lachancea meyersii CBS 8951]